MPPAGQPPQGGKKVLWAKEGGKARQPRPHGSEDGGPDANGAPGSTPLMETLRVGVVSSRTDPLLRVPTAWSKWGGSSVRRPSCCSLGNLVCPSGPGVSLAWLEPDASSHCSWSWTPSTPTRPAGSAETSMASPSSTSSSPTVSPGARAPLPAACSISVLPGSLPSRVPSQRSQS